MAKDGAPIAGKDNGRQAPILTQQRMSTSVPAEAASGRSSETEFVVEADGSVLYDHKGVSGRMGGDCTH